MSRSMRGLAALVVAAGLAACQRPSQATPVPDTWQVFEDGAMSLELPEWPAAGELGEFELTRVAELGRLVTISRYQGPPRLVGPNVAQALPDNGPFEPVELVSQQPETVVIQTTTNSEPFQRLRMSFYYCAGTTYSVGGASPVDSWQAFTAILDRVEASLTCAEAPVRAERHAKMVGLVVGPAGGDFSYGDYRQAAVQARSAGLEAAHVYLSWGRVETEPGVFDWTWTDMLVDSLWLEGLRLSMVIEFIHTSVPGEAPSDLEGLAFDDPAYMQRAAAFALAVADRYGDQLDYLAMGNEVNIYFAEHPQDLDPFLQAFQQIRLAVGGRHPELPIGTTLAFHEAQNNDRLDLIEAFKGGDFLAYTYYPHDPLFSYDVPADRFAGALQAMVEVSGETPFFVVENGFSSSALLGSSEERQAAYVEQSMQAYLGNEAATGRMIWVGQHDPATSCSPAAASFFPPDFDPAEIDPDAWQAFQEYLCTLGLRRADGTPKPAWSALLGSLPSSD